MDEPGTLGWTRIQVAGLLSLPESLQGPRSKGSSVKGSCVAPGFTLGEGSDQGGCPVGTGWFPGLGMGGTGD